MKERLLYKIPFFILLIILHIPCLAQISLFRQTGSDYQRNPDVLNHYGHIFFYVSNSHWDYTPHATFDIIVKEAGTTIYNFRLIPDRHALKAFDFIPLRVLGNTYEVEITVKGYGIVSGEEINFFVESKKNVIHGVNVRAVGLFRGTNRVISYSYSQEEFTNQIAEELLDPHYIEFTWMDLVKRNQSVDNVRPQSPTKGTGSNAKVEELIRQLEVIDKLLDDGLITKEEHEELRNKIISNL